MLSGLTTRIKFKDIKFPKLRNAYAFYVFTVPWKLQGSDSNHNSLCFAQKVGEYIIKRTFAPSIIILHNDLISKEL